MSTRISGKCLCGGVSFNIARTDHLDACHCSMCQTWTGSAFIGVDIRDGDIVFENKATLEWFESSDWAKRGFCRTCGSSLFYTLKDDPKFCAIAAGSLDLPDGATLTKEIFVDEKPSYYAFDGDRPRLTGEQFLAAMQASSPSDD